MLAVSTVEATLQGFAGYLYSKGIAGPEHLAAPRLCRSSAQE